jgi:4-hydroxythreonine-4-phosphate dehydrogenase
MMLQGGPLRVVLATIHLPLRDVPKALSTSLIMSKAELAHNFLKQELHRSPKIGIAGLNPHAGEGGILGREDLEIIEPAVKRLKEKGMDVRGPLAADTIFRKAYVGELDVVLAMYHDQGLGPLKMIAFDEGINVTLGLPYRRSSPDHGTAFDIAYQGKANSLSTEKAIEFLLKN